MDVTHVEIRLRGPESGNLLAFAVITLDDAFIIHDIKIISGPQGPFISMPSRRNTERCFGCGGKNHLTAQYCCSCGRRLAGDRSLSMESNRRLYADVAHPITPECRKKIQDAVLCAYAAEQKRAAGSDYLFPPRSGETSGELPGVDG